MASDLGLARDPQISIGDKPGHDSDTLRHARACRGHPRLIGASESKAWVAGTSPAMTESVADTDLDS
jgi:hypothetical protein